jgi:hypothetical protein
MPPWFVRALVRFIVMCCVPTIPSSLVSDAGRRFSVIVRPRLLSGSNHIVSWIAVKMSLSPSLSLSSSIDAFPYLTSSRSPRFDSIQFYSSSWAGLVKLSILRYQVDCPLSRFTPFYDFSSHDYLTIAHSFPLLTYERTSTPLSIP